MMSDSRNNDASLPPSAGYRLFEETQRRAAGDIRHKVLPGLVPAGYQLAVHRRLGIVTVMTCEEEEEARTKARMTHQQTFTPSDEHGTTGKGVSQL